MAALFLLQTLVGAACAALPGRARRASSASTSARWLPYNLVRTWHVQLALFWVATSFLAAGIFLAPMIARRETEGQGCSPSRCSGALAVVVFGTLIGEYVGIHGGWSATARHVVRALQGFEYLDLGRFWQVLLIGRAVLLGVSCSGAASAPAAGHREPGNMPWLFFFAALAIPAFYAVGPARRAGDSYDRHRVLALLGRAPLGGGLPRAVHDRDGRLHLRAARRRPRARRPARGLPRHRPLLAPAASSAPMHHLYFSGAPARAHGAGRVLLRCWR